MKMRYKLETFLRRLEVQNKKTYASFDELIEAVKE